MIFFFVKTHHGWLIALINSFFLRLKATDEDQGSNAKVTLSIVAGNKDGNFRINPKSGVLYVERPLDAELKSAYSLTVTALDHANTGMRKQSSAKVRIYIVDVNDNDPQFKVRIKVNVYKSRGEVFLWNRIWNFGKLDLQVPCGLQS